MATLSALERRAKELREGTARQRSSLEAFERGNSVFPGGSPNPNGNNGYTPYFDAQYELEKSDILGRQAQSSAFAQAASNRLRGDVRTEGSALTKLREKALQSNKYSMADQGILRSGINIAQQGEIGGDYLDATEELQKQFARGQEDIDTELAMQEAGFNRELMSAELLRGEREKEYRLEQALREAELKADQEALAATEREIELIKNEKLPKANAAGKYVPAGTAKKGTATPKKSFFNSAANKKAVAKRKADAIAKAKKQNKARKKKGLKPRSIKYSDILARRKKAKKK